MTLPFVNGWPAGSRNPNSAPFEINALEVTGTFMLASRLIVPRKICTSMTPAKRESNKIVPIPYLVGG